MSSYQATLKKRVKKLQKRNKPQSALAETSVSLRRKIADEPGGLMGFLTKPLPNMRALDGKLQRAEIHTPAKVFVMRGVFVMIAFIILFAAVGKPVWIGASIGGVLGIWLPLKYVNYRINKALKKFLQIFPDGIDLIVRGLRGRG